jgi:hypothetical protein
MAKEKDKRQRARGQAAAKAEAATSPKSRAKAAEPEQPKSVSKSTRNQPVSTDIRRKYMKSLLGDYLGAHRGAAAIKPKK